MLRMVTTLLGSKDVFECQAEGSARTEFAELVASRQHSRLAMCKFDRYDRRNFPTINSQRRL